MSASIALTTEINRNLSIFLKQMKALDSLAQALSKLSNGLPRQSFQSLKTINANMAKHKSALNIKPKFLAKVITHKNGSVTEPFQTSQLKECSLGYLSHFFQYEYFKLLGEVNTTGKPMDSKMQDMLNNLKKVIKVLDVMQKLEKTDKQAVNSLKETLFRGLSKVRDFELPVDGIQKLNNFIQERKTELSAQKAKSMMFHNSLRRTNADIHMQVNVSPTVEIPVEIPLALAEIRLSTPDSQTSAESHETFVTANAVWSVASTQPPSPTPSFDGFSVSSAETIEDNMSASNRLIRLNSDIKSQISIIHTKVKSTRDQSEKQAFIDSLIPHLKKYSDEISSALFAVKAEHKGSGELVNSEYQFASLLNNYIEPFLKVEKPSVKAFNRMHEYIFSLNEFVNWKGDIAAFLKTEVAKAFDPKYSQAELTATKKVLKGLRLPSTATVLA